MSLIDHTGRDRSLPRPRAEGTIGYPWGPVVEGPDGVTRHHDLVYAAEPGFRPQLLEIWRNSGDVSARPTQPLIVWVHGGGWLWGWHRRCSPAMYPHRQFARMVEAGFVVAMVDYRMARETNADGMCLDLRAAVRWLREHAAVFGIDPRRVAYWGESAGGHLALMTSYQDALAALPPVGEYPNQPEQVQAIVDWYGPTDARPPADELGPQMRNDPDYVVNPIELLLVDSAFDNAGISPLALVRPGLPPTCIAQGQLDGVVRPKYSRALHNALQEAGVDVRYLEAKGAGHVFADATSAEIDGVIDDCISFLGKHLGPER